MVAGTIGTIPVVKTRRHSLEYTSAGGQGLKQCVERRGRESLTMKPLILSLPRALSMADIGLRPLMPKPTPFDLYKQAFQCTHINICSYVRTVDFLVQFL
uniref:Uncharacterized protein n=1 Tax=Opuntia streptacantha TaxID=393608 RepID=A0A7C9EG27_OPUST